MHLVRDHLVIVRVLARRRVLAIGKEAIRSVVTRAGRVRSRFISEFRQCHLWHRYFHIYAEIGGI